MSKNFLQWTGENGIAMSNFIQQAFISGDNDSLKIELHGKTITAQTGDWICKDDDGDIEAYSPGMYSKLTRLKKIN